MGAKIPRLMFPPCQHKVKSKYRIYCCLFGDKCVSFFGNNVDGSELSNGPDIYMSLVPEFGAEQDLISVKKQQNQSKEADL